MCTVRVCMHFTKISCPEFITTYTLDVLLLRVGGCCDENVFHFVSSHHSHKNSKFFLLTPDDPLLSVSRGSQQTHTLTHKSTVHMYFP